MHADAFVLTGAGDVAAAAEIAEVVWHDPARDDRTLAPLSQVLVRSAE